VHFVRQCIQFVLVKEAPMFIKQCGGNCDQGRKVCPIPMICYQEDDKYPTRMEKIDLLVMSVVMLSLIAFCAYFIWLILGGFA
jgi:hypothetical protein